MQFEYKTIELEMDRPMKVIDQQIYDRQRNQVFRVISSRKAILTM